VSFSFALLACFFIAFLLFSAKRMKRYLRFFQQENYESCRFFFWVKKNGAFDTRATATLFIAAAVSLFSASFSLWLASCSFCLLFFFEPNPEKKGKLPLKLTKRAMRIYRLSFFLFASSAAFLLAFGPPWIFAAAVFLSQTLFLFLPLANLLLSPYESFLQKRYFLQAREKIAKDAPFTVAITGSYGKTSTKHLVGELLSFTLGPAFWTDGGINTLMGTTQQILNGYKKGTSYLVNEMAAHYKGSIAKLCALTPPDAGIVTGIGEAHLERFGSQEVIFEAKSELAQHVKEEGVLVLNGDDPYCRKMGGLYKKKTTRFFGFDKESSPHFLLTSYSQEQAGTAFSFTWEEKTYKGFIPLFGKAHLLNVAAALTLCFTLGADIEACLAFLRSFAPVSNRLEVKKELGIQFIHDAYNSNPKGFEEALLVLKNLPAKKRFCMTPGFIELGEKQYEHNFSIGKKIAKSCDACIIVGNYNKEALSKGIASTPSLTAVHFASSREEAFKLLKANAEKDDAVLIENDLPDLYEHKEHF